MATYEELTSLMEECTGSSCLWKRRYFANFGYTDGIKLFLKRQKRIGLLMLLEVIFRS